MQRLFLAAVLGLCAFGLPPAPAQEPLPPPRPTELPPLPVPLPAPVDLPAPCDSGCQCEKIISLPKLLLVEEQAAITVPKMRLREQTVGCDVIHKMEVTWKEEKHCITEMKAVPHTVEQQVCTTKMVPQTTIDPVCGKPCTTYVKVPEIKTVTITVYDVVPVQREVIVRMPCIKPVDVPVEIRKLVVDETEEAAILKRWNLVETPNEIRVMLPACPVPWFPVPCLP